MATHVYGDGTNSTSGSNTITHFYDRAGIKAANRVNVFGQFADRKWMPKKYGKTFKISKFLHTYDRPQSDSDFAKLGYLTGRDLSAVQTMLTNSQLPEGAGAVNEVTVEKVTVETTLARYGNMISYTDEVDLFSEDYIQVRYREELGELANSKYEDLIQLDMLATPTRLYSGTATSINTLGDGIATDGSEDDKWKVNYDLIRKSVRRLVRNRAKKNTSVITGSTKIDTKTVAAAYYAIIGSDVKSDLETLTRGNGAAEEFAYVPFHKYGDAAKAAEGEVGAMHEVRFIEAESMVVARAAGAAVPNGYTGSLQYSADDAGDNHFDAFPILFPTQGAFATVGLKGRSKIKFYAKPPSDVDLTNPYGTKGFFSANWFYAGILLEPEKCLVTWVCASK